MLKRIARLPFKILKTAVGAVRDGGEAQPSPSGAPRSQPPARRPHTEAPPAAASPAAAKAPEAPEADDHGHNHTHDGDAESPAISVQMETTPNPNAMKFMTNITLCSQGSKSWSSKEEAAGDPLGEALFDIPGVASVFMVNDFVTVSKDAGAGWGQLTHPVTEAIEQHATPA